MGGKRELPFTLALLLFLWGYSKQQQQHSARRPLSQQVDPDRPTLLYPRRIERTRETCRALTRDPTVTNNTSLSLSLSLSFEMTVSFCKLWDKRNSKYMGLPTGSLFERRRHGQKGMKSIDSHRDRSSAPPSTTRNAFG
ncbi:uncharacterized protein UTRI_02724 [Ustilago trichophora]|uniref:Secreted protein n=1 Tax=Ustilago trichophora TaxID=86804 RepID=A0A5C3EQU3_9BASI|nr:uncharacterized protein UTRI_02724 [Ustilago trichophora]